MEIRVEMFKGEVNGGGGIVTYDGTGNYTLKVHNDTITPTKFNDNPNPGNLFDDFARNLSIVGGNERLHVVTLVDGTGKVVATFHREGSGWKRMEAPTP